MFREGKEGVFKFKLINVQARYINKKDALVYEKSYFVKNG
jgi:hypothetical protein